MSSGAILSNYQRIRVENVYAPLFLLSSSCDRLGLISVAYMWEREQRALLRDIIQDGVVAVVIKTAAMGLDRRHIGKTLNQLEPSAAHRRHLRLQPVRRGRRVRDLHCRLPVVQAPHRAVSAAGGRER